MGVKERDCDAKDVTLFPRPDDAFFKQKKPNKCKEVGD